MLMSSIVLSSIVIIGNISANRNTMVIPILNVIIPLNTTEESRAKVVVACG